MNAQAVFLDEVIEFREELKEHAKMTKALRKRLDRIIDDYFEADAAEDDDDDDEDA